MPSNKITDAPDSALLKSNFLNGFPFDVLVSSYLMDSNYNIIYTVFENINLKPGQVDAKGKVVSPASIRNVDVSILKSGLDCLKRTKYIYVTGRLNTTNYQNQSIKIYRDDDKQGFLDVGMGIRINARIK